MVSGKYTFSVHELMTASDYATKESVRRGLRIFIIPVGIFMILASIFFKELGLAVRIYLGITGAYLAFLRRPVSRLILRKQFAKRPDQNIEVRFEGSDDGMTWSTPHSNANFKWSLIFKARQYSDGFLIFPNARIFHWIPNHALNGQEEIDQLSDLFQRNIQDYRKAA